MDVTPRDKAQTSPLPTEMLKKGRDYSHWVLFYTTSVTLVGIVILLLALAQLPRDWFGLCCFAVLAFVAELNNVEVFASGRQSTVSISAIIAIASIMLFGPLAGAFINMLSGLATALTSLKSQPHSDDRAPWLQRSAFNIAMFVIATAIGGYTYTLTGGTPGSVARLSNALPLFFATTVDTAANILLVLGVLVLQTGQRPQYIWKENFQWYAPIAIVGGFIGGGALALAYEMFNLLGVGVFFLPVISTGYALRLYTNNMRESVNRLEELNRDLDAANLGLLETLGAVIDADDVYTYGHSNQVAIYAQVIAEKMNLPPAQRELIVKAALVHDLGKVGVADTILGKPGPLTVEEYNLIKRHPNIGAEILGRMKGLKEVVPLVRYHHERWDGTGYPDGLQKEEIPLGARILALADTLDVLCSERPYRPTKSFREAKAEIARNSGTQFDPQVVEALFAIMDEKDRDFFKNSAASVDREILVNRIGGGGENVRRLKKSMREQD